MYFGAGYIDMLYGLSTCGWYTTVTKSPQITISRQVCFPKIPNEIRCIRGFYGRIGFPVLTRDTRLFRPAPFGSDHAVSGSGLRFDGRKTRIFTRNDYVNAAGLRSGISRNRLVSQPTKRGSLKYCSPGAYTHYTNRHARSVYLHSAAPIVYSYYVRVSLIKSDRFREPNVHSGFNTRIIIIIIIFPFSSVSRANSRAKFRLREPSTHNT